MFQKIPVRLALILVVLLGSGVLLYRNYTRTDSQGRPVRQIVDLGLDLQGGVHLALELDESKTQIPADQRVDAIDRALKVVRTRVDALGVSEPIIQKAGQHRIIVELAGLKNDQSRAKEVISKAAYLEFQLVRSIAELQPKLTAIDRAVAEAEGIRPTASAPRSPVGGLFKTAPGADSAGAAISTATPFSSKVQPASASDFIVRQQDVPAVERYLALPAVQRLLPGGTELRWGMDEPAQDGNTYRRLYVLETRAMMNGEHLEKAIAQTDPETLRAIVTFELSRVGGRRFEEATGRNIGRQMAIVLDERVHSAPVIQSQIGSRGQIEMGGGDLQEASDLALVLRAGALPAPLKIVEERAVGASLGDDSIQNGKVAGLVGILAVVLIMLGVYRLAGLFAITALSVYLVLVLGGIAMIGGVLTFPGIAGLILSIGMSVDANVLIFERIKEELSAGRTSRVAVSEGFRHALSAIVDSNLTTLITAGILFYVGTGPVQGFAVTLAIGILASMFTAIFVTRTLFMVYLERRGAAQTLSI